MAYTENNLDGAYEPLNHHGEKNWIKKRGSRGRLIFLSLVILGIIVTYTTLFILQKGRFPDFYYLQCSFTLLIALVGFVNALYQTPSKANQSSTFMRRFDYCIMGITWTAVLLTMEIRVILMVLVYLLEKNMRNAKSRPHYQSYGDWVIGGDAGTLATFASLVGLFLFLMLRELRAAARKMETEAAEHLCKLDRAEIETASRDRSGGSSSHTMPIAAGGSFSRICRGFIKFYEHLRMQSPNVRPLIKRTRRERLCSITLMTATFLIFYLGFCWSVPGPFRDFMERIKPDHDARSSKIQ